MSKSIETIKYLKSIPSSSCAINVPLTHHGSHLHNFENFYKDSNNQFWAKLKKAVTNILTLDVSKCPRFVFLCGRPGSGKTHFSIGLYRALVKKIDRGVGGGGVYYISFLSLTKDIVDGFQENMSLRQGLASYLVDKWLFVDDFTYSGKIFEKDSMEHLIFRDIVLNRWDTMSTLITSTNLEADLLTQKLSDVFGEYIVSRLSHSLIIQFPNEDLRIGFTEEM